MQAMDARRKLGITPIEIAHAVHHAACRIERIEDWWPSVAVHQPHLSHQSHHSWDCCCASHLDFTPSLCFVNLCAMLDLTDASDLHKMCLHSSVSCPSRSEQTSFQQQPNRQNRDQLSSYPLWWALWLTFGCEPRCMLLHCTFFVQPIPARLIYRDSAL